MQNPWWQTGIIYEIYPRSFQDSDGDGVGDLTGIISRLDYLHWLGVDAVWIGPIYPSPMADFGYDVAEYTGVDPLFGTLETFDRLLAEAHARGIRVILDLVPNHTSDRHPWFLQSRRSREDPKRGWYVWRDPAPDGGPPNNWLSSFGGPAWSFDEPTGQYYLHSFLPEQPDLNWRHPEMWPQMERVMRFWLDRGVDGFRVDVVWHLVKDARLRDNPRNPDYRPRRDPPNEALVPAFSADQPEVQEIVARMRRTTDEYPGRVLIGEAYLPFGRLVRYYGVASPGMHLPLNFHLITSPWEAVEVESTVAEYEGTLPPDAWPNWVLGNHDRSRVASRVGAGQARVAAMLLLTLRGTPVLYYGDEIGMPDAEIPPERMRDPRGKRIPGSSRDPARAPMRWDGSPGAGFTTGDPWLPAGGVPAGYSVEAQRDDPGSVLTLYRHLVRLRRAEPALHRGPYTPVPAAGENTLGYVREWQDRRFLVALNFGEGAARFRPERGTVQGRVVLSTRLDREGEAVDGGLELRGDEGVVVLLS
ncbi:MAG TPA: alpha-amylase family glycosyl hydrolase [Longimicrobiaceae bacterium]|nr:alpha-amylase family glycosyl hydrolase [Longimicrobiaceae bacterium]